MAKSSNVFDMERLLQYVDFMKENDLTEIDLEQDGQKVRLSRGGVVQPLAAAPAARGSSPELLADQAAAVAPPAVQDQKLSRPPRVLVS